MTGKILIYGGSGGIGVATAKALRARGYDLHLVGRSEDKLSAAAAEIQANFTVGDVTDRDLFARAAQEAGEALDGLVYAVGTINLRGSMAGGSGGGNSAIVPCSGSRLPAQESGR